MKNKAFIINSAFILLAVVLLWVSNTKTATIEALSCSQNNVQSAIISATAGDIVTIPSGFCTWSSPVSMTKGITVQGAGQTSSSGTVITASGTRLFSITGSGSGNFRIANMGFAGTCSDADIFIEGGWTSFRIDHINWNTSSVKGIILGYSTQGNDLFSGINYPSQKALIDNITYSTSDSSAGKPFLLLYGRGHRAWQEDDGFGSNNFVFIEASTFTWLGSAYGYVVDTEFGGRYVFRHNTVSNGWIGMHDLGSTPRSRGNRAAEIYDNTFTCTLGTGTCFTSVNFTRGGTGLFYNNSISGYSTPSWAMIYRVAYGNSFIGGGYCNQTGGMKVCQDTARHCSGGTRAGRPCYSNSDCPGSTCKIDYTCSSNSDCKDYNGNDGLCMQLDGSLVAGYPCRDQMGRGKDGATTGVQASSPAYWYNNTVDGIPNTGMSVGGSYSSYIQENRDFCNHSPATACESVSGWSYIPYTYPHPLIHGIFPLSTPQTSNPSISPP